MNNNNRFSILEAVKNAYVFVGREWRYLLKAGLLPMGAQVISSLFVQFQRPDSSLIEGYLWGLPASLLLGWFIFLETRLLLLGERLDRLPQDPAYLADRRHAMKLSILTAILFNMGVAGTLALSLAVEEAGETLSNGLLNIAGLFIIAGIVWGVRFGIVPTLAAVHYPIKPVLRQTAGMLFPLRLIGMGLLCMFPVIFIFRIFIAALMPTATSDLTEKLSDSEQVVLTIISTPLSLICAALLGAAAAYALKQILGPRRDGVTV
jgi:hypothetical protein